MAEDIVVPRPGNRQQRLVGGRGGIIKGRTIGKGYDDVLLPVNDQHRMGERGNFFSLAKVT